MQTKDMLTMGMLFITVPVFLSVIVNDLFVIYGGTSRKPAKVRGGGGWIGLVGRRY